MFQPGLSPSFKPIVRKADLLGSGVCAFWVINVASFTFTQLWWLEPEPLSLSVFNLGYLHLNTPSVAHSSSFSCVQLWIFILLLSISGESVEQSRRPVGVFNGALRNLQHSSGPSLPVFDPLLLGRRPGFLCVCVSSARGCWLCVCELLSAPFSRTRYLRNTLKECRVWHRGPLASRNKLSFGSKVAAKECEKVGD